jgi:hypothetical protein
LLRQRAANIKGKLTTAAMDAALGYPSSSTYRCRFDSWKDAREKTGLND